MKNQSNDKQEISFGSRKVTYLILYGSLGVSIILTSLLICYDLIYFNFLRERTFIGLITIGYLGLSYYFIRLRYIYAVNIMLIALYGFMAFITLLLWGLNSAIGIFATSFVIILAGILLGSRSIFPVTISVIILLCLVQIIHSTGIIEPNIKALSEDSSFLDVLTYTTVLSIFSLITWISDHQMEKSLKRAREAEQTIRTQKERLAHELEEESFRLRQVQLKEIQQLYKFATLGQSTAATLHELSNHLSILNMDIDDLKQQHKNSKAIENAKEGIQQINLMVKQVRRKLDSFDTRRSFNALNAIRRAIKDQQQRFDEKHVSLSYIHLGDSSFPVKGDPLALIQVVSILLHNAIDACFDFPNSEVAVKTVVEKRQLIISVQDNGVGIEDKVRNNLFSPTLSSKPSGLGVGLYIAKHLVESQFNGSIYLNEDTPSQGAEFIISIPKIKKI